MNPSYQNPPIGGFCCFIFFKKTLLIWFKHKTTNDYKNSKKLLLMTNASCETFKKIIKT
jgi:hypothetical protein